MGTATTVSPSAVLVIEKGEMFKALHEQHALSDRFIRFMLARSVRIEADRTDPLFNSGEKRLACTLLLFARYGKEDGPHGVLPKLTQEMLADMIGTTRSRVNLHQQIPEAGLHRVQLRASDQHFSLERGTARVSTNIRVYRKSDLLGLCLSSRFGHRPLKTAACNFRRWRQRRCLPRLLHRMICQHGW
jgi:hypothetical protein